MSLTAPAGGSSVSGTTPVSANAADNTALAGVQFRLNGANLGNEDTTAPYQIDWDTTTTANGTATLTAIARDSSGNTTTSNPLTVTVANQASATRYLSDLTATSQTNGWGPVERDRSNGEKAGGDGAPLTLNGTAYTKGLGMHAAADVRYAIPADCLSFTAQVGVDDEVGTLGSVVFEIWTDGVNVTSSALLTGAANTTTLTADVTGKSELRLVVTNGGDNMDYDHADWADAHFSCSQNTPPTVAITSPAAGTTWKVGDPIAFEAAGSDTQDGTLPPAAFDWTVLIQHCPSNCHSHTYQTFTDTASASFPAPDHEYPSHLELRVTATDANGATATASLDLHPKTVDLTFASSPSGLELVVGASSGTTPFTRTVIVGSTNSVSAPTPQTVAPNVYTFESWSQGGAATQLVEAPAAPATYTASYTTSTPAPPTVSLTAPAGGATVSGTTAVSATADDDTGVAGVQFKLDGGNLGNEDTTAPYQVDWDTTAAANGSHTLSATARDTSGATTTSSPINVTVSNNRPPTAVASASPL